MSDEEETGTEDDGQEQDTQLVYVCKKCNNKQFATVAERDAHREWHRDQRNKKKRPGPASASRKSRANSPTPSVAGTLFSVKAMQPRASRSKTAAKATPDTTSAKTRNKNAKKVYNKHWDDAKNMTKRFNSG